MLAEGLKKALASPFMLLAVFTVLLHSSSLRNGFVYDDMALFAENKFVHSLSNLPKIFTREYLTDRQELESRGMPDIGSGESTYRPVRTILYFLFYRVFGLFAPAWHLTSLLLHALNVCLLFVLIRRLSGHPEAAYFSALLFAAHPATTEAVHVVSFNGDLLALGSGLGAMLAYLKFRDSGRGRHYAVSIGLFLFGCFSKEPAVMLPALIVLHDWIYTAKGDLRVLWTRRLAYSGYLIALLAYLWVRFVAIYDPATVIGYSGHWSGAVRIIGSYLAGIVFPASVHPTLPGDPALISPALGDAVFVSSAVLIPALLAIAWTVRRSRPEWAFGIFWFFVGMLPIIGLSTSILAWRYLYIPMAGFFVPLACVISRGLSDEKKVRAVQTGFLAVLALFAVATSMAGLPWRSNDKLFREMVRRYPMLSASHSNLAGRAFIEGRFDEAIIEYEEAIRINPTYYKDYIYLGLCRQWQGRNDLALELYRKALAIKPDSVEALVYIGLLLEDPAEELAYYHRALRADPRSFLVWNAMGIHYAIRGDYDKAERCWKRSQELNRNFEMVAANLRALQLIREDEKKGASA